MTDKPLRPDLIQKFTIPKVRTFEIMAALTAPLPEGSSLNDWPAVIQDAVMAALERKAQEVELPLVVVYSETGFDADDGTPYAYILASEIVAAVKHPTHLPPGRTQ